MFYHSYDSILVILSWCEQWVRVMHYLPLFSGLLRARMYHVILHLGAFTKPSRWNRVISKDNLLETNDGWSGCRYGDFYNAWIIGHRFVHTRKFEQKKLPQFSHSHFAQSQWWNRESRIAFTIRQKKFLTKPGRIRIWNTIHFTDMSKDDLKN